ncbi:cysteine hydrolase family protein [Pseudovibrio sp. SPO723]|uniref:cysteine hydrolase family protein n=1 Tax=Nesiotobacter zosterae TaxID=392721 RepID=UPI0029C5F401|nr:cysteine hydrolase family protein [Pseudovibrio sp. SPO723]MDX5595552.1 cysteine hydrolase family protein [Pseudovibrio sp. SPO723]
MTNKALLIIDVQNDYFPGGAWELVGMEAAAANTAKLIEKTRSAGETVVHVQHVFTGGGAPFFNEGTEGVEIHESCKPLDGEALVQKPKANSFLDTNLKEVLDAAGVEELVVVGAMTQNCIDSTVRAAADLGYKVTVVHDACATRDLELNGEVIPAKAVQASFMAALGFSFASVIDTKAYLAA